MIMGHKLDVNARWVGISQEYGLVSFSFDLYRPRGRDLVRTREIAVSNKRRPSNTIRSVHVEQHRYSLMWVQTLAGVVIVISISKYFRQVDYSND